VRLVGGTLDGVLFGIAASDPFPSAAGLAVVMTAAALAAWVPARRAARIPPSVALASE
jgi:putative ABC transport system permease protein